MAEQSKALTEESVVPGQRRGTLCTYHEHTQDKDAIQACIASIRTSCARKKEELFKEATFKETVEEAEAEVNGDSDGHEG